MMVPGVKRKILELDSKPLVSRLLQLQTDLIKADEERQPRPVGLQPREDSQPSVEAKVPWDPEVPWQTPKRPRILGELDQELPGIGCEVAASEQMSMSRARYKTVLCKFFPTGACTKGEACSFAHGEHELNLNGSSTMGGTGIGVGGCGGCMGGCMGGWMRWAGWMGGHTSGMAGMVPRGYKTELCKYFSSGNCTKGAACTYAHGEEDLVSGSQPSSGGLAARYSQGTGDSLHEEGGAFVQMPRAYKTKMCKFFPMGTCQKGELCTYAHGEEELNLAQNGTGLGTATDMGMSMGSSTGVGNGMETSGVPAAFVSMAQGGHVMPGGGGGCGKWHKTVMCKFFPVGKCSKGNQCTFAHDDSELQQPGAGRWHGVVIPPGAMPASAVPAVMDRPSSGMGDSHGSKYKTVLCKYYASGSCHKGELCTFIHDEVDLGVRPPGAASSPCADSRNGCWSWSGKGFGSGFGGEESYGFGGGAPGWSSKCNAEVVRNLPFNGVVPGYMVRQMAEEFYQSSLASGLTGSQYPVDLAFKTQLCKYFPLGQCNKGADCNYAHGEDDLREYGTGRG